ncbi:MAG: hypothetical protein JSR33_04470 [Proteobacteria bacterium]|nr:hypothetical protein [Pseudomonadota bacterium]
MLPAEIISIYNTFSISELSYKCGTMESSLYTELKASQINLFGLQFDSITLPIEIVFTGAKTQVFIAAIVKWQELELESQLPSQLKDWKLSLEYKCVPAKNVTKIMEDFLGLQSPNWLSEKCPEISLISVNIHPFHGTFEIFLKTGEKPWILFNPLISISALQLAVTRNRIEKSTKTEIALKGELNFCNNNVQFQMNNKDMSALKIQGEIKKESVQKFLETVFLSTNKDNTPSDCKEKILTTLCSGIPDVKYILTFDKIEFSTPSLLVNVYKHKEPNEIHKWHYLIDYHPSDGKSLLPMDNLKDLLPESIQEILESTDLRCVYSSRKMTTPPYKKGLSLALKIPIHKLPLLKEIVSGEFFLPIQVTHDQKTEIKCQNIKLADEINIGIGKLSNAEIDIIFKPPTININAELDIVVLPRVRGSLVIEIPTRTIKGQFALSKKFEILGLEINDLAIGIEYQSATLSAGVSANFQVMEDKTKKEIKQLQGRVECGFGATGLTSLNAQFSKNAFLSVKEFAKTLLSIEKRQSCSTMLDVLDQLFPIALTPVNDPYFIEAIQKSSNRDLKNLADKYKDCLIFSVDIPTILASISGQINIGDIFVAFIMLDISLKSGLTLIGGIKPIHLFDGLIQVKRSTQIACLSEEKKPPLDIDGPVIYARIPGWESFFNSEGFKSFRIHANAYIQFFDLSVDAKLEMSAAGFDLYFNSKLDFPFMLLDTLLHIQVDKNGFSFEVAAQLSLSIAVLKLFLLTAKGKFKISYDTQSNDKALNIDCDLLLNSMNRETSFLFTYSLPKEKCQTLAFLADNLLSLLSESLITENQKNASLQAITSLTDDQYEAYLAKVTGEFQRLLYPSEIKVSENIQVRNSKLCLLRCLLRINTPAQILQAFKLLSNIEKMESDRVQFLMQSPKSMLKTGIVAMKNKPLMAFCYFRFLESHLSHVLCSREKGLVKYYLGVMYANDDAPISVRFQTRSDKLIDAHYKYNYYCSRSELLKISIQLFIESFEYLNKDLKEKDSLTHILPLYRLWKYRKSYYLYQKIVDRELSAELSKCLFDQDTKQNSSRKNFGEIHQPEIQAKDVFLEATLKTVKQFLSKIKPESISSISIQNLKITFILLTQIVIHSNKDLETEIKLISDFCNHKFKNEIVNSYKDILKIIMFDQKQRRESKQDIPLEGFIIEIIKNINKYNEYFDPLLGEYYFLLFSPLLYYTYGYHLCDVKQEENSTIGIKTAFFKAVERVTVKREIFHHPTLTEWDCLTVLTTSPIYYHAYKPLSDLYTVGSLHSLESHQDQKEGLKECKECKEQSIKYNIKYLKNLFSSDGYIKIEKKPDAMLMGSPLDTASLIAFDTFQDLTKEGYDLVLISINIKQKIYSQYINGFLKKNPTLIEKPILIKHGNQFIIYGLSEQDKWQLTQGLEEGKFKNLNFGNPIDELKHGNNPIILSRDEVPKEVYEEITLKKGHPYLKFNLRRLKSTLATVNSLKIAEEIFSLNSQEILNDELRKIISLQAMMLRLEIFRFYLALLGNNFLPAFFELKRFLKRFEVSIRCSSKTFEHFLPLLNDFSSVSNTENNPTLTIIELLTQNKILSLSLQIVKKRFFEEKIAMTQLSSGLGLNEADGFSFNYTITSDLQSTEDPLKMVRETIEAKYKGLSDSQKKELYKLRLKTPLFFVPYIKLKDSSKYLFWENESKYLNPDLNTVSEARIKRYTTPSKTQKTPV